MDAPSFGRRGGGGSGSLNSWALQASCLVARLLQGLPVGDMHQHGVETPWRHSGLKTVKLEVPGVLLMKEGINK